MLSAYAADTYFAGAGSGYTNYALKERSLLATFRRLLGQLSRRGMTGGALLDVGCGYGFFLDAARGSFTSRSGTDFSATAASHARRRADHVHVGGTTAVPATARYDLITALHVIEHVYQPRAFVSDLFRRLTPGGWLVVATPDMGSPWRRIMRNRWPSFKIPEHVAFYDEATLTDLLATTTGASDTVTLPYPHAFPLADLLARLGLPAPRSAHTVNVWLPATTVCVAIRKHR